MSDELHESNLVETPAERRARGEIDYQRLREMLDAGTRAESENLSERAYERLAALRRTSEVQREEQARADRDGIEPKPGMTHEQLLGGWPTIRAELVEQARPPTLAKLIDGAAEHAARLKIAKERLEVATADAKTADDAVSSLDAEVVAAEQGIQRHDEAIKEAERHLFDAYRQKGDANGAALAVEESTMRHGVAKRKIIAAKAVRDEARAKAEEFRQALNGAQREHAMATVQVARAKFAAAAQPLVDKMAKQLRPLLEEFRQAGAAAHGLFGVFDPRLNRIVPRAVSSDEEKQNSPDAILARAINDALGGEK
jgi:hypothetical protein